MGCIHDTRISLLHNIIQTHRYTNIHGNNNKDSLTSSFFLPPDHPRWIPDSPYNLHKTWRCERGQTTTFRSFLPLLLLLIIIIEKFFFAGDKINHAEQRHSPNYDAIKLSCYRWYITYYLAAGSFFFFFSLQLTNIGKSGTERSSVKSKRWAA